MKGNRFPVDSTSHRCCGGIGRHTHNCRAGTAIPADETLLQHHLDAAAGHIASAIECAERLVNRPDADLLTLAEQIVTLDTIRTQLAHITAVSR